MRRYPKTMAVVVLLGVALALPLLAQNWVAGYCLSCVTRTYCGTGCRETNNFLGVEKVCRTCGPVQGFTYACTACNWHKYQCTPLIPGITCPPYYLLLAKFENEGNNVRPLVCRVIGDYIYCTEL